MSLRYGLRSARDLYAKLRNDAATLEARVSSEVTFNFMVTAYHLSEWIERDPAVVADATLLRRLKRSLWFRACRDLANASKHFELDPKRNPNPTKRAESKTGYGMGRYGVGPYGRGEESIVIELANGNKVSVLELAKRVMALYEPFFEGPTG